MRRSSEFWHLTSVLLGTGVMLLAAATPAAAQLADSPWPMLQHDERHTGRSHFLGPNFPSGAPGPDNVAVWDGFDKVKSSPTIAPDGTIYVGVAWSVCAINPTVVNGELQDAWDSSSPPPTPRPFCRRLVADASASSAAIGKDGTLYLGDRGNTLNAFDPDGNVVWLYSHGHEGDIRTSPVIGPESSPGANDGLIYIGFSQNLDGPGSLAAVYSGPPPPLGVGGTLKWSYTGGNFVNTSSPALDNGTVYFGDILGWFHAVNADTGAFLWKVKIGNQISASPVIVPPGLSHAGRIYVGSTNGVSAVDPATHDLDPTFAAGTATPGTFATDGAVDQTPALGANGTIYAGAKASKRKTFYAINPDGTLKWVFGPIQTDADNAAFAIVSGEDNGLAGGQEKGTVYVAIGKTVYALRPADGTVLWSYSVPMNIISFPAISGGATWQDGGTATLYVPSYDGNVYALSSYRGPQGLNNTPPTVTASASSDGITVASPQSLTVAPGQSITFNGIGSDSENDPLTFTWDFGDNTAPFAGTSVLHSYATAGSFTAKLRVSDGNSPPLEKSIPITVASAGTFSAADSFDRGANTTNIGSATLAGAPGQAPWTEVGGDKFTITSNELRNTPGTSNHLAVLKSAGGPSVTGPTQVVEASFASTDNQGAPKVGLVLRYKDPDNFYLAYRKAGPASFLRIAKVVAGTETVLTQLALPSPQVNTFFRLTATAVGTTLTLDLNGVSKLSVDDLTFSNGSVGVVVDPGTSATAIHRVNDFTANVQ